jgi:hypothetical protein
VGAGATSLIIVSVQALSNRQPVRTTIPLMCDMDTRDSLIKYVQLSTFFLKGEASNIDVTVNPVM